MEAVLGASLFVATLTAFLWIACSIFHKRPPTE